MTSEATSLLGLGSQATASVIGNAEASENHVASKEDGAAAPGNESKVQVSAEGIDLTELLDKSIEVRLSASLRLLIFSKEVTGARKNFYFFWGP